LNGILISIDPRQNVSAGRNAQRNLFSETLFIQNLSFDGAALVLGSFFAVFLRGDFVPAKRFTEYISGGRKTGGQPRSSIAAGAS
jgi:hypothetical protein